MSSYTLRHAGVCELDNCREPSDTELCELHRQYSAEHWAAVVAEMQPVVATLLASFDHAQQAAHDQKVVDSFIDQSRQKYVLENPPPGFAAVLANAILQGSYQPASEIAIASALGLLAGVCGRAFVIPSGKDCALYILLVAKSGVGKEAPHEAIQKLIELSGIPLAEYFVCVIDFASGPALQKHILDKPGSLWMSGEWGKKLRRMANDKDAPMQELRNVITKTYGKDKLDGVYYSDPEKNKEPVRWPALSLLGETTPGTLAESLTPSMMEDGFLSRFNIISYEGNWQQPNRDRQPYYLSPEHLAHWQSIIRRALPYQGAGPLVPATRIQVEYGSDSTKERMEAFENECGMRLHSIDDESERQVYTRAALKAYKIASLLAIADNPIRPMIFNDHAQWAIDLIRRDIAAFVDRKECGDVGRTDDARTLKVKKILTDFIKGKVAPSYKVDPRMIADGIVPRDFIQKRVGTNNPAFNAHPQGHVAAIDAVIKNLKENGSLQEILKDKAIEVYGFHGRCFRVLKVD